LEIAELLINSGANLELGCSTPLMEAAQEGHVDLVKYLIAAGDILAATSSCKLVLYRSIFWFLFWEIPQFSELFCEQCTTTGLTVLCSGQPE